MIPRTDPRFVDSDEEVIEASPRRPNHVEACVLVAGNDPDAAFRFTRTLAQMGMRAVVTPTGREALDRLAKLDEPIALACVDVGLNDVSGLEVAAEARRLRPRMPIVFVSGALGDVLSGDGVVLCKPFTSDHFRAAFDAAVLGEQDTRHEIPVDSILPDEVVLISA